MVANAWEEDMRVGKRRLIPEEFALHLGRNGGTARLAATGASTLVVSGEEGRRPAHFWCTRGVHGGSAMCFGILLGREREQEEARTRNLVRIEEGGVLAACCWEYVAEW